MHINIAFKNFEPSEHLKKYAHRRLEKLGRFADKNEQLAAQITLTVDKFRQKADVLLTGKNVHISAEEQSGDMYSSLDLVLDKLESQLKRQLEKLKEHGRPARVRLKNRPEEERSIDVFTYSTVGEGEERAIVGTNNFSPEPMDIEDAAMRLDSAADQEFLVFLNAGNGRVNVIYRRRNGDFGLIDPVLRTLSVTPRMSRLPGCVSVAAYTGFPYAPV